MAVNACPLCGSNAHVPFVQRGQVPVHQNLVVDSAEAARNSMRGELDLAACEACGFVWNRAFDLSLLAYGDDYDNTQHCSGFFEDYLKGLAHKLIDQHQVRDCTIVEVGCGSGHFLRKLVEDESLGNQGIGFDPSYVGSESACDGRLQFQKRYYDASCSEIAADVVICRHVIEHVPDPLLLLRAVRAALAASPNARVFFETPCVEWILKNRVVWDFFYEHCSLFSASSLTYAFERAGFVVSQVQHVFGGQYLWLEATVALEGQATALPKQMVHKQAADYAASEQALKERWRTQLMTLGAGGKVALWGAGAKGATLANIVDTEGALIDCVVDVNPNKQGGFIPGTGHAIVAPEELAARGVVSAVLMNPNYRQENLALLAELGLAVDLVDWSDE